MLCVRATNDLYIDPLTVVEDYSTAGPGTCSRHHDRYSWSGAWRVRLRLDGRRILRPVPGGVDQYLQSAATAPESHVWVSVGPDRRPTQRAASQKDPLAWSSLPDCMSSSQPPLADGGRGSNYERLTELSMRLTARDRNVDLESAWLEAAELAR